MKKPLVLPGVLLAVATLIAALYYSSSTRLADPGRRFTTSELRPEWNKETVEVMERVPKTDDGRTKSLHTFAHYELLRNRALSSITLKMQDGDGKAISSRTLSPVAWLLDVLFYPEIANQYPIFNVEDSQSLVQVGLTPHEKRRDKYSYAELAPARTQLYTERTRLAQIPTEKQDRIQRQINDLASNLIRYENLINFLNFARNGVTVPAGVPDEPLKSKAGQKVPLTEVLAAFKQSPGFRDFMISARAGNQVQPPVLFPVIDAFMADTSTLIWYAPPKAGQPEAWAPAAGLIRDYLVDGPHAGTALGQLQALEQIASLAADPARNPELQAAVRNLGEGLIAQAKNSGSYGKVALDRGYLKAGLFSAAKWTFLLLFLMLAVSWIAPGSRGSRIVTRICFWGAVLGYGLVLTAMAWRVIITGWGPVTNIYETIPFITLIAGIFSLIMEMIFRNRIPLILAIFCGVAGMFLAGRYEAGDAADTMPSLVAVLRSNYWLWTHVTTINIGYATVLLAAMFSMIYIFCRLFDLGRQNAALFRMLTQSAYGILCFGLVFSLIGTILGGIWGNDSWGRFWGWDPKENGALVIVLWCLAVLHMRLAGWIREIGLHVCTAFGANFCLFSWWHVNLLNVGLHSYGFTQGLEEKLMISYCIVTLVVVLGIVVKFLESYAIRQASPPADSNTQLTPQASH